MFDRHLYKDKISFAGLRELFSFLCTTRGVNILRNPDEIIDWAQEYCPSDRIELEIIGRILRDDEIREELIDEVEKLVYQYLRVPLLNEFTDKIYKQFYYDENKTYECVSILVDAAMCANNNGEALLKLYGTKYYFTQFKGLYLLECVATEHHNVHASALFAQEYEKYQYWFRPDAKKICFEHAEIAMKYGDYSFLSRSFLELYNDADKIKEIINKATSNDPRLSEYSLLPYKYYTFDYAMEAIQHYDFSFLKKRFFEFYCTREESEVLISEAEKNGYLVFIHEILPEKYYTYELAKDAILKGYVDNIEGSCLGNMTVDEALEIIKLAYSHGCEKNLYSVLAFEYADKDEDNVDLVEEICMLGHIAGYEDTFETFLNDFSSCLTNLFPDCPGESDRKYGLLLDRYCRHVVNRKIKCKYLNEDNILKLCLFFEEDDKEKFNYWVKFLRDRGFEVNYSLDFIYDEERDHYNIVFDD